MEKRPQAFDFPNFQQSSDMADVTHNAENRNDKAALPDEALGQVSAAGDMTIPTMNPEVLLGRHDTPEGTQKRKP